jgi:S-adenosylmethionine/arginine decarboxylase-like enzyme
MYLDHKHIILNALVNKPFVDVQETEDWLRRLVAAVGMKLVIGPHAHYCTAENNNGITATCCIETSHASLHLWDKVEKPYLRFDLYSCATFDPNIILNLVQELEPTEVDYIILDRNATKIRIPIFIEQT